MLNRTLRYIGRCSLALVLLFVSCVKNDEAEVCESYVSFVYNYNMAYTDLFHREVSRVELYLFDRNGVYAGRLKDQASSGTFPAGYKMQLPRGLETGTQFVAWAGDYAGQCNLSELTPGVSKLADLRLKIKGYEGNEFNGEFDPVWHGSIVEPTRSIAYQNETTVVSLTKNTNNIRILLLPSTSDFTVDVSDFAFRLTTVNGEYDYLNSVSGDQEWHYTPFLAQNDPETGGVVVEISTMRLLEDRENRLTIKYTPEDETILDEDFTNFLRTVRDKGYPAMGLQEYMDRESDFKMIVYLSEPEDPEDNAYVSGDITINDWYVREQEEGTERP